VDLALLSEGGAVAAEARWEDAVEHVDAAFYGFGDVFGGADAHDVAGFVFWEVGDYGIDNLPGEFTGFAYGQAADGDAWCVEFSHEFC